MGDCKEQFPRFLDKMKNIKIVFVDIDGTLLNDQKQTTPKTIQAIAKLKEKGIFFGIASGRSPLAIRKMLPEWHLAGLVDIVMGFNGAQYFDFHFAKEACSHQLNGQIVKEILTVYQSFDISFGIFDGDEYHVTRDEKTTQMIVRNNHLKMVVEDLSSYTKKEVTKILVSGKKEQVDKVEAYYQSHPSHFYRCVRSTKEILEFLDPQVSKTFGIASIVKNYGYTLENVCVFGDELNDLEMIRDCGVGVLMGNGNPKLQAVADYVTGSNNEDGIAQFIEKYLL